MGQEQETIINKGRLVIFIDGNNLFHAAKIFGIEIDYSKLLATLCEGGTLLRAFFYTGVDEHAEKQKGFLLWMRRNGYRVVEKELKTFSDGSKKANLDVEIAVDMLSLSSSYDTAILVSGDEDFAYAVNAVAFKGCRVEVAGFRHNTAPKLIDVADRYIELDSMLDKIAKSYDKSKISADSPLFLAEYESDYWANGDSEGGNGNSVLAADSENKQQVKDKHR